MAVFLILLVLCFACSLEPHETTTTTKIVTIVPTLSPIIRTSTKTPSPSHSATSSTFYRQTVIAQTLIPSRETPHPWSEIPHWLTPVAHFSQSDALINNEDQSLHFQLLRAYLGWDFEDAYFAPVDSDLYKIWFESVSLPDNWFIGEESSSPSGRFKVFWAFPPTPTPLPNVTLTPMEFRAWWLDDNLVIHEVGSSETYLIRLNARRKCMPVDFLGWIDDEVFAYGHCDDQSRHAISAVSAKERKVLGTILVAWYITDQ